MTITGSSFRAGPPLVTFAGAPCRNIRVLGDGAIMCRTPPHRAGTVDVVVFINGVPASRILPFTYVGGGGGGDEGGGDQGGGDAGGGDQGGGDQGGGGGDHDDCEDGGGVGGPDNDGDGVSNATEIRYGTNPNSRDTDNDTISDCTEWGGNGTGPPRDTDRDGVPDVRDLDSDEDFDGYLDKDGCPDFDDDLGYAVKKEEPQPEIPKNGGKATKDVVLTPATIEIYKPVLFDVDKDTLRPVSYDILGQVASVLLSHPEITRVRVEGHTDSTAGDGYNLGLSWKRARRVVETLATMGVSSDRLESMGYGERAPISDNLTDDGRQQNRRVVFTILSRTGKPVASQ